jgi:CPA2 family monovalent cation:H+ antiporter-2
VSSDYLTGHVLLVGYGRVGKRIAAALLARGVRLVVAEENRERVEQLRAQGLHAVAGDASEPAVLIQAHVARARLLVVAIPDTFHVRRMIETARALNPGIQVIIRSHSEEEAALLQQDGATEVFLGEETLAVAMAGRVLEKAAASDKVH